LIPPRLRPEIEAVTGHVEHAASVGGGSFGQGLRLEAERGTFFLKLGDGETLGAEAVGLSALGEAAERTGLRIPRVFHARSRDPGFLVLDWIPSGRADRAYWIRLGEGLAALHRKEPAGEGYGFSSDNFIGATPQVNGWSADWPAFFRDRRLRPQFELARRKGRWRRGWDRWAERFLGSLEDLLPRTPERSLLHGDLWGGNHLPGEDGSPWLIDPAVYVGHREADLAMTELFGGFAASFYEAYRASWPLDPGYPERREVYNLYHLVNHLNLFGESYAASVERILARFG